MLTETVAGRTYDYSHNVGRGSQSGMGFNWPNAMTFAPDGTVYVANRGSESISNALQSISNPTLCLVALQQQVEEALPVITADDHVAAELDP